MSINKGTVNLRTVKRSMRYLRPYWYYVIASLLCSAVCAAAELVIPIFCGLAIDQMIDQGKVLFEGVERYAIYVAVTACLGALCHWLLEAVNHEIICCVSRDLRDQTSTKIHRLPMSYLDEQASGDVVSRVVSDVDIFAEGLLAGFAELFVGLLTIVGTLIIMLIYNVTVTIIVVVLTPISMFVTAYIARKTHKYFVEQAEVRGEQTALIDEAMDGQQIIRAYCREQEVLEEFDEVNERYEKAAIKATYLSSLANPGSRLINNIVYAAVCVSCGLLAVNGDITIGQLSVFLEYAAHYAHPFNEISGVVTELQNALTCVRRVFDLLDSPEEPPEVRDGDEFTAQGGVELRDVSFSYTPDEPLMEHLSLSVRPGQHIAIVGETGSGKTTLINLLMRFYDVDEGAIYLDGVDIRTLKRGVLRRNFGMVLQESWLHSGTVKQNIAYGRPDATDDEIIAAAKAVHAHSFIRRLPQGYDTVITEHGDNLSAGQRQLICIARVMLCLPPLLILDEATSSLDSRTELKIQSAFKKMMEGRTCFIIAHRLSTIRDADLILVMSHGHIVEQGTHADLIAAGGYYSTLYNSQFEGLTKH